MINGYGFKFLKPITFIGFINKRLWRSVFQSGLHKHFDTTNCLTIVKNKEKIAIRIVQNSSKQFRKAQRQFKNRPTAFKTNQKHSKYFKIENMYVNSVHY